MCVRLMQLLIFLLSIKHVKISVVQAILSSGFIPIFSGWLPPKFQGVRYMDGCYSDNLPILDENTITVSPFCGESDICPRDKTVNLMQVCLFFYVLALCSFFYCMFASFFKLDIYV